MSRLSSLKLAGFSLLAASTLFLSSCAEDPITPGEDPKTAYNFSPDMNYGGQTVRLMLADSLLKIVKGLDDAGAMPVSKAHLESLFDNTNGLFASIAADKKLSDKVSNQLNANMVGQYRAWFDSLATRSATYAGTPAAVTTADGLYLPELLEKGFMGSIFYAQAVDYLVNKVPTANNSTNVPGQGTAMAHNWDEAFGYFGASQNYLTQTTEQRRIAAGIDVNSDGKIDPATERTVYHARYAATADFTDTTYTNKGKQDFGNKIMQAFIDGREAIAKNDVAKRTAAVTAILSNWDKTFIANAIRYAGTAKTRMGTGANYDGPWAELSQFVDMTQYWGGNALGSKYSEVRALIGNKPSDVDAAKIDQIVTLLKTAYGF
ncbi:MAG TPA: DUF4856 domain-containing protein [Candidatus Kapabacteria bacterium]|nr:DUF4856 domain-containing protein [Candidatus Kapabacteria bacterium]